mgnify:CR=1 FL=1
MPVTYEKRDGVAVIVIDSPPVNALSAPVKRDLGAQIDRALADPAVHAVVLMGGGRHFSAGADIKEFDSAVQASALPDLVNAVERAARTFGFVHSVIRDDRGVRLRQDGRNGAPDPRQWPD